MTTAIITLRDGTQATIKGREFTVEGLEDIPFIVHRDIQRPTLWMVTEPVTGARILSSAKMQQKLAIYAAQDRCKIEAARAHVRREVAAARARLQMVSL